ncbi:hypothetical protein [uncultured Friedmanniella sp.]|uniref:hypothetical protein n=1 Tax=uncultured Friedmanniella sp. TaxID=335381 RepID=UPI0035CAE723
MTSTSSPTPTSSSRRGRHALGRAGVAVAAAGVTTLASALLGAGPSPAQADPGDTYVATGSSQLLQSEDLQSLQVPLDTAKVVLGRDGDFSSCLGEGNRWTDVLSGSPKPVTSVWTRRGHPGEQLSEHLAQAPTEAVAKKWEATLVSQGIKACRKPTTDFHYGPVHVDGVGAGNASWAVFYRGNAKYAHGGVAVIREGVNVGFVEVYGHWGPSWQTMEGVSKQAVHRLD